LKLEGRYFVFSSHVITTGTQLSAFMESGSSRDVIVRELPIISSVNVAKSAFNLVSLPPHQALFYGLVPAIIYTAMFDNYPISKREQAITDCIPLVSNETVLTLLRSFLTGELDVMAPLLSLMDNFMISKSRFIRWIPFHIVEVLSAFLSPNIILDNYLKQHLKQIVNLFVNFQKSKTESGDGWGNLFLIVFLIRCITVSFDSDILKLSKCFQNTTVSFNELFNIPEHSNFDQITNVDEFVKNFVKPKYIPHISIYYPTNANFEIYDVIVATYATDYQPHL
jgi:hypothetical protein